MERVEKMALQTALEQVTLSIRSTESIYSFCFTIKLTQSSSKLYALSILIHLIYLFLTVLILCS